MLKIVSKLLLTSGRCTSPAPIFILIFKDIKDSFVRFWLTLTITLVTLNKVKFFTTEIVQTGVLGLFRNFFKYIWIRFFMRALSGESPAFFLVKKSL